MGEYNSLGSSSKTEDLRAVYIGRFVNAFGPLPITYYNEEYLCYQLFCNGYSDDWIAADFSDVLL